MLGERLDASSIVLLERVGAELRPVVGVPPVQSGFLLPAEGFLANRIRSYQLSAALYGRRSRKLAAMGDRAPAETRSRASDLDRRRRANGRSAPSQGRLTRHPVARTQSIVALRSVRSRRMLLRQCADQLTLMIENARLTSRVVEQEKLRRDVALAAEVQRRLLPDRSSPARGHGARGPQPAGAQRRRRLLRLSRSRRTPYRDRARGHRRQGRGGGAHHGRRAGVAQDRRLGWRDVVARSGGEDERLPASLDGVEQLRDVLLRPARRAQSAAAVRERRSQSAISASRRRTCDGRCRRYASSRLAEQCSDSFRR